MSLSRSRSIKVHLTSVKFRQKKKKKSDFFILQVKHSQSQPCSFSYFLFFLTLCRNIVVSWHLNLPAPSDRKTRPCPGSVYYSLTWHREHGVGKMGRRAGSNNILCIHAQTTKNAKTHAHLHCITCHFYPRSITASSLSTPTHSVNEWGQYSLPVQPVFFLFFPIAIQKHSFTTWSIQTGQECKWMTQHVTWLSDIRTQAGGATWF